MAPNPSGSSGVVKIVNPDPNDRRPITVVYGFVDEYKDSGDSIKHVILIDKPIVSIGRSNDCLIRIPQDVVSRLHCEMVWEDREMLLVHRSEKKATRILLDDKSTRIYNSKYKELKIGGERRPLGVETTFKVGRKKFTWRLFVSGPVPYMPGALVRLRHSLAPRQDEDPASVSQSLAAQQTATRDRDRETAAGAEKVYNVIAKKDDNDTHEDITKQRQQLLKNESQESWDQELKTGDASKESSNVHDADTEPCSPPTDGEAITSPVGVAVVLQNNSATDNQPESLNDENDQKSYTEAKPCSRSHSPPEEEATFTDTYFVFSDEERPEDETEFSPADSEDEEAEDDSEDKEQRVEERKSKVKVTEEEQSEVEDEDEFEQFEGDEIEEKGENKEPKADPDKEPISEDEGKDLKQDREKEPEDEDEDDLLLDPRLARLASQSGTDSSSASRAPSSSSITKPEDEEGVNKSIKNSESDSRTAGVRDETTLISEPEPVQLKVPVLNLVQKIETETESGQEEQKQMQTGTEASMSACTSTDLSEIKLIPSLPPEPDTDTVVGGPSSACSLSVPPPSSALESASAYVISLPGQLGADDFSQMNLDLQNLNVTPADFDPVAVCVGESQPDTDNFLLGLAEMDSPRLRSLSVGVGGNGNNFVMTSNSRSVAQSPQSRSLSSLELEILKRMDEQNQTIIMELKKLNENMMARERRKRKRRRKRNAQAWEVASAVRSSTVTATAERTQEQLQRIKTEINTNMSSSLGLRQEVEFELESPPPAKRSPSAPAPLPVPTPWQWSAPRTQAVIEQFMCDHCGHFIWGQEAVQAHSGYNAGHAHTEEVEVAEDEAESSTEAGARRLSNSTLD